MEANAVNNNAITARYKVLAHRPTMAYRMASKMIRSMSPLPNTAYLMCATRVKITVPAITRASRYITRTIRRVTSGVVQRSTSSD